jgi:hypothetical protein
LVVDEIDHVLTQYYRISMMMSWILSFNYDIKYRMGKELDAEE